MAGKTLGRDRFLVEKHREVRRFQGNAFNDLSFHVLREKLFGQAGRVTVVPLALWGSSGKISKGSRHSPTSCDHASLSKTTRRQKFLFECKP